MWAPLGVSGEEKMRGCGEEDQTWALPGGHLKEPRPTRAPGLRRAGGVQQCPWRPEFPRNCGHSLMAAVALEVSLSRSPLCGWFRTNGHAVCGVRGGEKAARTKA